MEPISETQKITQVKISGGKWIPSPPNGHEKSRIGKYVLPSKPTSEFDQQGRIIQYHDCYLLMEDGTVLKWRDYFVEELTSSLRDYLGLESPSSDWHVPQRYDGEIIYDKLGEPVLTFIEESTVPITHTPKGLLNKIKISPR